MRIAVSSGKGGTGKTTVATNLAVTAARAGRRVGYLDCDVEEPNGFLFLKPQMNETRPVNVSIPKVDLARCNGCGLCGEICQYNAIAAMNKQVLVFHELCHGCAGCWLVCPTGAITESCRQTGQLELGMAGDIHCVQGPPRNRCRKARCPRGGSACHRFAAGDVVSCHRKRAAQ